MLGMTEKLDRIISKQESSASAIEEVKEGIRTIPTNVYSSVAQNVE